MKKRSAGWHNFRYGKNKSAKLIQPKPLTKQEWLERFGEFERERWENEERARAEVLREQAGGKNVPLGGDIITNVWKGD